MRSQASVALFFILSYFSLLSLSTCQPFSSSLPHSPSPTPTPKPAAAAHLRRIIFGILLGSLTGLSASILLLLAIRIAIIFFNLTPILNGPVTFSPAIRPKTLAIALSTQCHSHNLLSSTSTWHYYKITLDEKLVFAIKCPQPVYTNASKTPYFKSFIRKTQKELDLLAAVRHENVMSLKAYVFHDCRFSLVFDYIPNGCLMAAMERVRSGLLHLGWEERFRIAIGVAKGLRYLHFECHPRILHYGLKPSNVMLSEDFEPLLSDCGLAALFVPDNGWREGSTGYYIAPECLLSSNRYTDKSDVFSFGMILAALLTGRDPSDPFFEEGPGRGGLARWLDHLQHAGEARTGLDPSILGEEEEEEEMLMAVRVAMCCLADVPADRPSSDELVAMLSQLHGC